MIKKLMWKIKRRFTKVTEGDRTFYRVYDSLLSKFKRQVMDIVFAIAITMKVTPKKLVKNMDDKKLTKYAQDFVDEINKQSQEEALKLKKQVEAQMKKDIKTQDKEFVKKLKDKGIEIKVAKNKKV
jgi:ACT domain-containing protein